MPPKKMKTKYNTRLPIMQTTRQAKRFRK